MFLSKDAKETATGRLFVAQGGHGIDLRGATSRRVAGKKGGQQENGSDGGESAVVDGADAVKQVFHHATDTPRTGQAEEDADHSEAEAFLQDHAENLLRTRAEGHAQTDFVSALRDGEGHDAINAEGGEDQGDEGKGAEENGAETIAPHRFVEHLIHGLDVGHGEVGVQGLDDGRDAGGGAGGIAEGTNSHVNAWPRTLREGDNDFGALAVLGIATPNIFVNSDYLPGNGRAKFCKPGNQLLYRDALGEGIDVGEIFADELSVHDGDGHTPRSIGFRERATARDANAESLEIPGRGHVEAGAGALRGIVHFFSHDVEVHAEVHAIDRHSCVDRRAGDTEKSVDALEQLPIEGEHLFGLRAAFGGHGQGKGEQMIGAETGIDVSDIPEAVNGESRGGKKREREGELGDDESVTNAMAADPHRAVTAAFLERVVEVEADGLERGSAPEEDAGEHGGGEGEK